MSLTLAHLAPHSRVWVFQADRILDAAEVNCINEKMGDFVPQWASHGNDLYGAFSVEEKLFLVVAVDEERSPTSGCSIDALTRIVKEIGAELQVDFFNRMAIAYENRQGKIEIVSMTEFKQYISMNKVTPETIVFNNLVNTKLEFETNWRTAVKNSWHTNLFQLV